MPSFLHIAMHFFLQVAIVLLTYLALTPVFRKLGQAQVIAIMVAGFVLGPSVLGWLWPAGQAWLFPTKLAFGDHNLSHPNLVAIYVVGQLGLVLYMFMVGASFNLQLLSTHLRQAATTSAVGIACPMLLGGVVGWWLVSSRGFFTQDIQPWQGGIFMAAAVAVTAFPMLAWIIYDSGLVDSRMGTLALACAAIDDAAAWIILAAVVASTKGKTSGALLALGGGVVFVAIMISAVRPLLMKLFQWSASRVDLQGGNRAFPTAHFCGVLVVILTAAWVTDLVGCYCVLGAFVAGAVMPRGEPLLTITQRMDPLVSYLLLPCFFVYSGLNAHIELIFNRSVLMAAAVVLLAAFVGKFGGVALAARWQGLSWSEAGSIGALTNARGLMELILLNIGFENRVITSELYTILALMTIVTTFAATPLHRMFESRSITYSDVIT